MIGIIMTGVNVYLSIGLIIGVFCFLIRLAFKDEHNYKSELQSFLITIFCWPIYLWLEKQFVRLRKDGHTDTEKMKTMVLEEIQERIDALHAEADEMDEKRKEIIRKRKEKFKK